MGGDRITRYKNYREIIAKYYYRWLQTSAFLSKQWNQCEFGQFQITLNLLTLEIMIHKPARTCQYVG